MAGLIYTQADLQSSGLWKKPVRYLLNEGYESGLDSHFGHTHYRQNRYHAIMRIVQDQDTWKIHQIDLLDEQRLL